MTSHELAHQLLAGPDLLVTVRGYEGGVDEITLVKEAKPLLLNINSAWYYGKHEYLHDEPYLADGDGLKAEGLPLAIHIG